MIVCFYQYLDAVAINTGFTVGSGLIVLENVNCSGNETRLIDCPGVLQEQGVQTCTHDQDVGIRCSKSLMVLGCNSLSLTPYAL